MVDSEYLYYSIKILGLITYFMSLKKTILITPMLCILRDFSFFPFNINTFH